MNITHLIRKGRVDPILETDAHGVEMLVGWQRKDDSRKDGRWTLPKPQAWVRHDEIQAGRAHTPGVQIILDERKRQIQFEGYDAAHDDEHRTGEIARAALTYEREPAQRTMVSYALDGNGEVCAIGPAVEGEPTVPESWPWHPRWWKPSDDRVRELAKAGALYMAEADRLRRAGEPGKADDVLKQALGCASGIDNLYRVTPMSPGPHLLGAGK